MAVYIVYPPARACPVSFSGGDFWQRPESFSLTLKNTSSKPIRNVSVISEMFLAPNDLRRPYNFEWPPTGTIAPGQQQTLQRTGIRASSAPTVLGWVFFPYSVKYSDGSVWQPQGEGECFQVFWRDKGHPEMPALPPRQIEMNPD